MSQKVKRKELNNNMTNEAKERKKTSFFSNIENVDR